MLGKYLLKQPPFPIPLYLPLLDITYMDIHEVQQPISRRGNRPSTSTTTEQLLHCGIIHSGRHWRISPVQTKQVPPRPSWYLQIRHLNRRRQGNLTQRLERQDKMVTRPIHMAASTYPPPQIMGDLESSIHVYLQPVKEPLTILLTQILNLTRWCTPHRVGVFQTVGNIIETYQGRMEIIQPHNHKTRPINPQEVQKSWWWYKPPPSRGNLPYSCIRSPLIHHKIHRHWSSPPTLYHNPGPRHMESQTPSLRDYRKTHFQVNPSRYSNCSEWRVLPKHMGHSSPCNWRQKISHTIIKYTSTTPVHPEDQEAYRSKI